ncbi:MAG: cupin domain-containing protein [Dehalococcoidia bacterium]
MSEHEPTYTRQHGPLQVPVRVLRFEDQIASLQKEPAWQRGERAAKTLVKEGRLRVVLTLMRAATELHEHKTEGATTIQCLSGRMKVNSLGRSIELIEGEMIALDGGVPHAVEAIGESAFLLTIAD